MSEIGSRIRVLGAGLLASAMVALSSPHAMAGLLETARQDGISVGYFNQRPFAFLDESGQLRGESVDIANYVLGKMGITKVNGVSVEFATLIPGLNARRFDIVTSGMAIRPERCQQVQFSEPTYGAKQTLIVRKGNPDGVTDYDSIREKNLTLAAVTGGESIGFARLSKIPEDHILQLPDTATALSGLRSGRASALSLAALGARAIVANDPQQSFELTPLFAEVGGKFATSHAAFAFRKDDAAFVAEFNKVLTAFIGSPEHLAMVKPYGITPADMPIRTTAQLCAG